MQPIVLKIMLDPATGQLGVEGPLDKALLALGMIESAKHIILTHQNKAVEPKPDLVIAQGDAALDFARKARS